MFVSETEQRPHLLLPVPDTAGPQVYPLCQCPTPGPEAFQPPPQYHMRSEGLSWFADGSYHQAILMLLIY